MMRITTYDSRVKIPEVLMVMDPMVVWLDSRTKLEIHRGDKLKEISRKLRKFLGLGQKNARELAAYYFALGERRFGDPWAKSSRELRVKPNRRYRP